MKKVLLLFLSLLMCTGTFAGIVVFFYYMEPSVLNLGIITVISALGFICSYTIFYSSMIKPIKEEITTVKQRLEWYKIALAKFENGYDGVGVCILLKTHCPDFYYLWYIKGYSSKKLLPELNTHRTTKGCFWFDYKEERVYALKACIKELS